MLTIVVEEVRCDGADVTAQTQNRRGFWQNLFKRDGHKTPEEAPAVAATPQQVAAPELEIAPNDPILAYLASVSGVVEVELIDLDSPALRAIKSADVKLVVPLVSLPYRRRAGRNEGTEQLSSLGKGESVLFYSDGLVEAHDERREMFGFLLSELTRFTGEDWEHDITLVYLERSEGL